MEGRWRYKKTILRSSRVVPSSDLRMRILCSRSGQPGFGAWQSGRDGRLVLNQIRIGRDRGDGVCVWRLGQ